MNDADFLEVTKTMEQLSSDLSWGFFFHASEGGIFYVSVKVDLQKLKDDEKI